MKYKLFLIAFIVALMASISTDIMAQQPRYSDYTYDDVTFNAKYKYRPLIAHNVRADQYLGVVLERNETTSQILTLVGYDNTMNVIYSRKYNFYDMDGRFISLDPQELKYDELRDRYVLVANGFIADVGIRTVIITFDANGVFIRLYHTEADPNYAAKHVRLDIVKDLYIVGHNHRIFAFQPDINTVVWNKIIINPLVDEIPFVGDICHDNANNIYCIGFFPSNIGTPLFNFVLDLAGNVISNSYYYGIPNMLIGSYYPMVCQFFNERNRLLVTYATSAGTTLNSYVVFSINATNPFDFIAYQYPGLAEFNSISVQDMYLRERENQLFINGWIKSDLVSGTILKGSFMSQLDPSTLMPVLHRRYLSPLAGSTPGEYCKINVTQLFYYTGLNIITNFGYIENRTDIARDTLDRLYVSDAYDRSPLRNCRENRVEIRPERFDARLDRFDFYDRELRLEISEVIRERKCEFARIAMCPELYSGNFRITDNEGVQQEEFFTATNDQIDFAESVLNLEFKIFDVNGNVLMSDKIQNPILSITSLTSGVYFLSVIKQDGTSIHDKFTVIR